MLPRTHAATEYQIMNASPLSADRRPLVASKFLAKVVEPKGPVRKLIVRGEAVGGDSIEDVALEPSRQQEHPHILTLEVAAKAGPESQSFSDCEKVWPLLYVENPAKNHYTEVKILNGTQRFLVNIIFA